MGKSQNDFLQTFKEAFTNKFGSDVIWAGGQVVGNKVQLPRIASLRRDGRFNRSEEFELGDLRADFCGRTIIIEYESGAICFPNLLKFWPYVRGELSIKPRYPLVICHFSSWWSYGSHRDLWDWTMSRMQNDSERIVEVVGRQFDNGITIGSIDMVLRERSIQEALEWMDQLCVNSARSSAT